MLESREGLCGGWATCRGTSLCVSDRSFLGQEVGGGGQGESLQSFIVLKMVSATKHLWCESSEKIRTS